MAETTEALSKFTYRGYWRHMPAFKKEAPTVWLYVFASLDLVKVGIAKNVEARLEGLRQYSAAPIVIVGRSGVRADVAAVAELRSHQALEQFHERSEWFRCEGALALRTIRIQTARANRIDERWVRAGGDPRFWPRAKARPSRNTARVPPESLARG